MSLANAHFMDFAAHFVGAQKGPEGDLVLPELLDLKKLDYSVASLHAERRHERAAWKSAQAHPERSRGQRALPRHGGTGAPARVTPDLQVLEPVPTGARQQEPSTARLTLADQRARSARCLDTLLSQPFGFLFMEAPRTSARARPPGTKARSNVPCTRSRLFDREA